MTYEQLYQLGMQSKDRGSVDDYSLRALLLSLSPYKTQSELLIHFHTECTNFSSFLPSLDRLKQGEPIAYILRQTPFYGLTLKVSSDVLIPRPETEELVDYVVHHIKQPFSKILDIATGSGAICCALKVFLPNAILYASDISEKALNIAKENANTLNLSIDYRLGNMVEPWIKEEETFDWIISNPPYISEINTIDTHVLHYEPPLALLANPSTKFYEIILRDCRKIIKKDGTFIFEINPKDVDTLAKMSQQYYPHATIEIIKDINQKERFIVIQLKEKQA
jgi:release factor glutamine methyltransferase